MASVDWAARVLYIDQSELTEVTAGELYELDTDWLWTTIHDLQDDEGGMANPDIMFHSQPYTMSGNTGVHHRDVPAAWPSGAVPRLPRSIVRVPPPPA